MLLLVVTSLGANLKSPTLGWEAEPFLPFLDAFLDFAGVPGGESNLFCFTARAERRIPDNVASGISGLEDNTSTLEERERLPFTGLPLTLRRL